MSVINWINHPTMPVKDKLIMVLYELRTANRYQLAKLCAKSVRNIEKIIEQINQEAAQKRGVQVGKQVKRGHGLGIRSRRGNNKIPRMYSLGPVAWERAMEYREEKLEYVEHTGTQDEHFAGLNDILVRLIEAKRKEQVEKQIEGLEWRNTNEAAQDLIYIWEMGRWEEWKRDERKKREEMKKIIHPDAKVCWNGQVFWLEFDNISEWGEKLRGKYRNYIETFNPIPRETGLHSPVVWVTHERSRLEYLEQQWKQVKVHPRFKDYQQKPEMYFFLSGEETTFLMEYNSLVSA
ncbi:replication-relaxation family protein [Desmospora activa]|uniref:Protein involved in plasmid replication-relaxation n=1 Tax=Desmospora activa DSM 45169 TaxID=1121389 RepID=A0A2T4YZS6_9BACL|nr:replication-relaxation family protein [Desmospora activa]PTM52721.1 protein involved in plasmid replication-relaxation [Desmospora activa DSM 45169]